MRIIGHGIDLVAVNRIEELLARHGDRFRERVFTTHERSRSDGSKREAQHLGARFAAKEAVLKALGTGFTGGVHWTEIEVVTLPSGQPTIAVSGQAAAMAIARGITGWQLSLSHTDGHAIASVIATGE